MAEIVDLEVRLITETDNAYLVSHDDSTKAWIPKSKIEHWQELDFGIYELSIPEWLAIEKSLV